MIKASCRTLVVSCLLLLGSCTAAVDVGDEPASTVDLEALMTQARIPGLTVARLRGGAIESVEMLGVASVSTGAPVTAEALFEAASLSKPVFATGVLRMAERGEFDLDRPLLDLLPYERVSHDPRAEALTARIVLSHRTGLPNWGGETLEFSHDPGTRFGYSGEGYVYLQKVVSEVTGLTLDAFARREVFEPLGMEHSRFSWAEGDELVLADPHDETGAALEKQPDYEGNAAASLHTTAADYARFVAAWLGGELLSEESMAEALTPVAFMQGDERNEGLPEEIWSRIAWALGWGVQLDARKGAEPGTDISVDPLFWHWGDNGPFKAFVAFRPATGDGVVYFANAQNGLAIGPPLVSGVVGDMNPTFEWCGYERVDSPGFSDRLEGGLAEKEWRLEDALAAWRSALEVNPSDEDTTRRVKWIGELIAVSKDPVPIADEDLAAYAGTYGPRVVTLDDGVLHYQRGSGAKYALIPLGPDLFALRGLTWFRIEFARDEGGMVTGILGHYANGPSDESPRDPDS